MNPGFGNSMLEFWVLVLLFPQKVRTLASETLWSNLEFGKLCAGTPSRFWFSPQGVWRNSVWNPGTPRAQSSNPGLEIPLSLLLLS